MLFEPYVCFHNLVQFGLLSDRLLGYSYLLGLRYVFLVQVLKCHFSSIPPLGLWSGNFFLIAPFPDHCLLVPSNYIYLQ